MAKTRIAFKQIDLDGTEFQGSSVGVISLKTAGVAHSKLADLGGTGHVIRSSALTNDAASGQIDNDHLATGNYSNITGVGTQGQDLDMGNYLIKNCQDPVNDQDAATRKYVLGLSTGIQWKNSVKLAIDLAGSNFSAHMSADFSSLEDGQAVSDFDASGSGNWSTGDRFLVMNSSSASEDGVYVITATAPASVAALKTDFRAADEGMEDQDSAKAIAIFIREGTYADEGWFQAGDASGGNDVIFNDDSAPLNWVHITGTSFAVQADEGLSYAEPTISIVDDGIVAAKLKARRETKAIDSVAMGVITAGVNYVAFDAPNANDAGKQDAELAKFYLNGVLLTAASSQALSDGDYYVDPAQGFKLNSALAAEGDKVEIRFIMAA